MKKDVTQEKRMSSNPKFPNMDIRIPNTDSQDTAGRGGRGTTDMDNMVRGIAHLFQGLVLPQFPTFFHLKIFLQPVRSRQVLLNKALSPAFEVYVRMR